MILLLDTHLLLWGAAEPDRLPLQARGLMEDSGNRLMFSAASIWEVAIKHSLGRTDFAVHPGPFRRGLLDNDYLELPVSGAHAVAAAALPLLHKDPFDRMLVAQSIAEGYTLLTVDPRVAAYPGPIQHFG